MDAEADFGGGVLVKEGPATWWSEYSKRLEASGIGTTSRTVIETDARYILDRGIFGAGEPGSPNWPASRSRSGAVMGAVQSGKTASMMALTALCLDNRVDAVVILAGTRRSLWQQTFERFVAQLDVLPHRMSQRDLMPSPAVMTGGAIPAPASLYALQRQRVRSALRSRRPIVAIAMKNTAHLEQLARLMRDTVAPEVKSAGRPFHLVVIDDEADDSSIDNLVQEPGAEALTLEVKQVPRRILDLWKPRKSDGGTFNDMWFATYVAYTATPQANFLQDPENLLAPRDFVVGLRTPGRIGGLVPRESTYRAPEGLNAWYTGGEVYYRTLDAVPLCVPATDSSEDLVDGVRAFLVASAIRWLRSERNLTPADAVKAQFTSLADAKEALPPVASMLVNPAASLGEHFQVAGRILAWSRSGDASAPIDFAAASDRRLRHEGIVTDMDSNPERWIRWLEDYARSSDECARVYGIERRQTPVVDDWPSVRAVVLQSIVPATAIAVINSDDNADDRPQFDPVERAGSWCAPPNLSTIFVSGNVMSRGLTLEGLMTTAFIRPAATPLADTQMQMQRWFGYRGSYIDLCRVFMRAEQIDLFRHYHENDEALRADILGAMNGGGVAPAPTILQGRAFSATGKIANVRGVSLSPGHRPIFTQMNSPSADESNREVVRELLLEDGLIIGDPREPRGFVAARRYSLAETASLLDRLAFASEDATAGEAAANLWASATRVAGIESDDPLVPLYRAKAECASAQSSSPAMVAAYLRYWAACLNRLVPGLYTTDDRPRAWRLLDQHALAARDADFMIGVRFGLGRPVTRGSLAGLPFDVRPMTREVTAEGRIMPAWGAQNGPVRGDDFLDYEARGETPAATADRVRPVGANGLVLLHIIDREPDEPTVAVGYSIPRGGPDFVQARSGRGD